MAGKELDWQDEGIFSYAIDPDQKTVLFYIGDDGFEMPAKDIYEIGTRLVTAAMIANGGGDSNHEAGINRTARTAHTAAEPHSRRTKEG